MRKTLFRKEALNKLSSQDELEELNQIVPSKGYLSLLTMFILIAILIIWGVWGDIFDYILAAFNN